MFSRQFTGLLAGIAIASLATAAQAETDLEKALADGAKPLTSDELAEGLTGKTVTFVSAEGGAPSFIYYGADNEIAGAKGDARRAGFYAGNERGQVCLGWEGRDLPRLRCLDVLLIDGKMHKFGSDGALQGHISETADGNTT